MLPKYYLLLFYNFFVDWSLVAHKKECGGSEINQGGFKGVEDCASICKGVASMFAFGTNDYLNNRCYSEGCKCLCETAASDEGTCSQVAHNGFRLYKYEKGNYHIFCK